MCINKVFIYSYGGVMEQEKTVQVMLRMKPSRLLKLDALATMLNARSRAEAVSILVDSVTGIQPVKVTPGKVKVDLLPETAQQN
jgi:hypothetical protein